MNQELGYLREELSTHVRFYNESAHRTINTVLLIWGGLCLILGNIKIGCIENDFKNIPLYFIAASIFFVSNLVLYFTARELYNLTYGNFRQAAYISVFYERRPSSTVKVGDNFFWELSNFEIDHSPSRYKNVIYKWEKRIECSILAIVSTVFMLLFEVAFFYFDRLEVAAGIGIVLLLQCIIYSVFSAYCLYEIFRLTYLIDECRMRVQHLKNFIQYALETGRDDEKSLKDRLGKVWDIVYPNGERPEIIADNGVISAGSGG